MGIILIRVMQPNVRESGQMSAVLLDPNIYKKSKNFKTILKWILSEYVKLRNHICPGLK